jgi:hypothetical protein
MSLRRLSLAVALLRSQSLQSLEQEILHNTNVPAGTIYPF